MSDGRWEADGTELTTLSGKIRVFAPRWWQVWRWFWYWRQPIRGKVIVTFGDDRGETYRATAQNAWFL
jgi:hypothetical protein